MKEIKEQFTRKVAYNFGFNKLTKVQKIIEEYGVKPHCSFGDSRSDIPLLDSSDYPICVGDTLKERGYRNIDFDQSMEEIMNSIGL